MRVGTVGKEWVCIPQRCKNSIGKRSCKSPKLFIYQKTKNTKCLHITSIDEGSMFKKCLVWVNLSRLHII